MSKKNFINYSDNLEVFKIPHLQRPLSETHVNHLIDSIQRENRLHLHPIIVSTSNYVEDGQHRIEACKRLGIGIYYIINTSYSDEAMIDDQIQKKWSLKDYYNFYVKKEYKEYIKIKKLMEESKLDFQQIYCIFSNSKWDSSEKFKKGEFTLSERNEKFLKALAYYQSSILKKFPTAKNIFYRKDFVKAFYDFFREQQSRFNRMAENLQNYIGDMPAKATSSTYYNFFVTIFNKHKDKNGAITKKNEFSCIEMD